jgi:hypothetical protein
MLPTRCRPNDMTAIHQDIDLTAAATLSAILRRLDGAWSSST